MQHATSIIDPAFTSTMHELGRLGPDELDVATWYRHMADVDRALTRLCDAIDDPRVGDPPPLQLARDAFTAVLTLGQLLHESSSDDPRASATLSLTRGAVHELLDALEPFVTAEDRAARFVLLDGEPLETALQRVSCT